MAVETFPDVPNDDVGTTVQNYVDAGAKKALREGGKSLLPPGVARCDGDFEAGEVVRVCDLDGTEFARGIAGFASDEIKARKLQRVEVVHRDNLVIL